MTENQVIHGFRVEYMQPLPEINATLCRMTYEKNGADLVWLDREDDNKTFAITFRTLPKDDTGVFHILEHSVLNGSEKYPVKEPFVELLKSSLQTFLNAMTYPDKTMYPVCSRNPQDFLNLMDVYLDGVFHPLSLKCQDSFRQEGWHYELDNKDGELRYNGVVFNEMKGAYASADTIIESEMDKLLLPDTPYRYDSGGYPENIPELTYENYLASHARFYHPSNARVFLDGTMDIDVVLSKIDSYFKEYSAIEVDADIPMQAPVSPAPVTSRYEITPDEDSENKVLLAQGWVLGRYDELDKSVACSVLTQALCSSNESPLKKALLENDLCEDIEFQVTDGIQQLMSLMIIRNTSKDKIDEIWDTINTTLQGLVDNGLDHSRIASLLDHMEFVTKERDFGSYPKGLIYCITSMESWLYGGDPAQNLCYGNLFDVLRSKIDSGYFEQLLRDCFLNNPHCGKLTLLPSSTLGQETREKEAAKLAAIKETWNDNETEAVMQEFAHLRKVQNTPDSPEALASIPLLSLSDIEKNVKEYKQEVLEIDRTTVLYHDLATNGIVYLNLYFDMSDIPMKDLSGIAFASSLMSHIATADHDTLALQSEIERCLGRFSVGVSVVSKASVIRDCKPMLCVTIAALESRWDDVIRLTDEILNRTDFSNLQQIQYMIRQSALEMEQTITMSGNSYGVMRLTSGITAKDAVSEQFKGISFLRYLQDTVKRFPQDGASICDGYASAMKNVISRDRVTVSLTGPMDEAHLRQLLSILPAVPMGEAVSHAPTARAPEGFLIPADIGFAAKGHNLNALGLNSSGAYRVGSQILSYDYLWNTIRVKGGAYGTGLSVRPDGTVCFSSYRDPNPAASLGSFNGAAASLREIAESGEPIDKFIISTISDLEPIMTPRLEGVTAAIAYLSERTTADRQKLRDEVLAATPADLAAFADVLDRVCKEAGVCVIGSNDTLAACGDKLASIEPITAN